jgi:hypothetical protein
LLEVKFFGSGKDFPIQPAKIIARGVFTMFSELDRESTHWAAMFARDNTLNDGSSFEFDKPKPGQNISIKVFPIIAQA